MVIALTLGYWVYAMPPSAPKRYILTADTIITMDDANPEVEAILIDDGVISAVGTLDALTLKSDAEVIRKDGVLIPGFIEPHTHPIASAMLGASVDISSIKYSSRSEIMAALKAAADKSALTPWLIAYGWDPVAIPELTPPTREELDAISRDRPILILTQMLHDAYVNTAAVEAAGITLEGSLLHETIAVDSVVTKIPPPATEVTELLVRRQYARYAQGGFTTIGVTGAVGRHEDPVGLLKKISTEPTSPLRTFIYLIQRQLNQHIIGGDLDFAILGAKFWIDGSPFTGGAATETPYEQNEFVNDYLNIPAGFKDNILNPADRLEKRIEKLHAQGYQIALHVQGERAVEAALEAIERVQAAHPIPNLNHRLEHNALITKAQMERASRLKVSLGFFVDHVYYYGHVLPKFFGDERMARYMPVNTAFQSGSVVTLHGDHPATPIDALQTLRTATTREARFGDGKTAESEAITRHQALQAMTISAAKQLGQQDMLGSISVGKQADFTALSGNPLTDDLGELEVLGTWRSGQPVDQRAVSWLRPQLIWGALKSMLWGN
ncbi:MAG: amidohydrolase [Hyphomicrobiales bacterium]|nr:amidohydrolase [Hyphomicrobiales bacterium]